MSFLLDTDTCSAHLKGNPHLTSRLLQYTGRLSVSVIVVGELLTWANRRGAPRRRLVGIQDFFQEVEVLPVCETVAGQFARIRAEQLDSGQLTPSIDLWIAATAITHDLTLVTHNTRDYRNIPGLSLADWVAP